MASLITTKGLNIGQRFELTGACTVIGRQPDAAIYLESLAVSRHHARILFDQGVYFVEDLDSSNGTYVNGTRISGRLPLTVTDDLQIGPYVFNLLADQPAPSSDMDPIIRARVDAVPSNQTLYTQNPAYKLQVVLEIAQHLGHTLDIEPLLGRLLEHLLRLFPQADRGMVVLCEGDQLMIRAQRTRQKGDQDDFPFSRTLVRRALEEGVGLLSEDVGCDPKVVVTATLASLNLRSFLCVPLIGWEGRRLGVIQLDCLQKGQMFRREDLELLTALGLQVAVVLQNAAYHVERLREERLRQELMLAREIQQSFMPTDFDVLDQHGAELFARVQPAREVSGDLYDFFRLPDGRLAFFLGDVSGKGMPAALYMIAVHTLSRHLAPSASGPVDLLHRLNTALVADNPTALFVTLIYGIYDDREGSVVLASGAHPPPLLRRPDGRVEEVPVRPGMMLGYAPGKLKMTDVHLVLHPGETLILYSDGMTEAFAPDGKTMFGLERLCEVLGGSRTVLSLRACAEEARAAVDRFTGPSEQQDDQTLFLLRRSQPTALV
jgi:serine phosphatase RsbU (regulator of sigma subunit)/pSer/pThr/pTyr-binding forkhead associated (FHA) protein